MPHAPDDPRVKAAYQELIRQTVDQYRALEAAGFKFWLFDGATDPYGGNPWNAMRDLRKNKSMGVYATADGFGSGATELDVSQNPLLADTGIRWPAGAPDGPLQPVLANDLFRAVHDAFGHGIEGAGFRARGEENAWQAHSRLFYGDALGAITSETRGQNSWLNYGPYGEKNRTARVEDTVFADQKTGLMPEWTWREGRAGDAPDTFNQSGRASDELIFGQPAYHGSPKVFDKFKWSDETRGTGEGAQAFGDGLYFAGRKGVAEYYRDMLTENAVTVKFDGIVEADTGRISTTRDYALGRVRMYGGVDEAIENLASRSPMHEQVAKQVNDSIAWLEANRDRIEVERNVGRLYKVDIPDDDELLNWDARLYDQPAMLEKIDAALAKVGMTREEIEDTLDQDPRVATGAQFYIALSEALGENANVDNASGWGSTGNVGDGTVRQPNPAAASRLLREAGIPGHRFLDQNSRAAGEGTYNYVIYDDSRVDIIDYEQEVRNDASTWEADAGRSSEEPRGQIQFKDGKSLMKLFDGADSSTALHESGHHFLMMIKSMAERTDTGPGIKEDWAQVKSWLAVNAKDVARESGTNITADDVLAVLNRNTSGDRMKDIAINRGIHEQWARGFEAYLLEGKSPSTGMRGVFESFKKWLGAIYASAKALNVNLTPEIRQVFDRLLTDEAATPERAVVTAPERPANAPTLDPPPVERADAGLVTAAAAVGKSENVAGFEEQIGAKLDGTYTEEGDIEMLRSLGRVLPEEEAMLKQADDGYADAVAYEKAIKVALACVIP